MSGRANDFSPVTLKRSDWAIRYNQTHADESHAFVLRVLMELDPDDRRRDGLVQWLFLNKSRPSASSWRKRGVPGYGVRM